MQTTGGEMSSVGQLVVMPGAGLRTEERSCNCRYKYYDPCQHPFIVVTITFTSIMHSTILQQAPELCIYGVNNDARCSDVDKSSALLSEE